jgi:hypothetical protein
MKTFNLDCPNEVENFISEYKTLKGRRLANLLGMNGRGSVRNADSLSCYAWNKLTAMNLRKRGQIRDAVQYESIYDQIYNTMPDCIKW